MLTKVRLSPSESATKFLVGKKKRGSDGNMWIIKETKTGVKRWYKHKKESEKTNSKESKSEFPRKLTFTQPPFGIVLIQNGKLGYKRDTRTRLGIDKEGRVFFMAKKQKYVQNILNKKVFMLT
jgi:hypothetical protein